MQALGISQHLPTQRPCSSQYLSSCYVALGLHPRLGYQPAVLQPEAVLDVQVGLA